MSRLPMTALGSDLPARELRTTLSELGLQIVGCHINPLNLDRLPAILDYQAEIGNPRSAVLPAG